ncbi:MAG TPA: glycosyltransferase, partial [Actinomycetota bacterium]|nr:glycosyltransferase [Actinomycetota bacterium]
KGIEDFLATIPLLQSRFPQMQFLLAGGPLFEDDRAYFNEISSRAASVPDLRVTGRLEDTAPAYAAMDVFVHLAEPEGFPTTAIEALASGVPIIGYDWGGIAEMVAGRAGTLVPPRDVAAAAEAVAALASDRDVQQQTSSAARRLAENRYSIDRFAEDLERAVNQAAEIPR